jgi:hypothetical protein
MTFTYKGETYRAFTGSGLLAALGNANDHFAGKLPTPGCWMETDSTGLHFEWRLGNFLD